MLRKVALVLKTVTGIYDSFIASFKYSLSHLPENTVWFIYYLSARTTKLQKAKLSKEKFQADIKVRPEVPFPVEN